MTEITVTCVSEVELVRGMAADSYVVQAARVSTIGAVQERAMTDSDEGLIRFLSRNRHGSPFEHNMMTFRIHAPIVVWREFMRHRIGFSYNEESGRYKKMEPEFYLPPQDRPLFQLGTPGAYRLVPIGQPMYDAGIVELVKLYDHSWQTYINLLELGWAREAARLALPVSVFSTAYVTCNARSLMNFLEDATYPSFPMYEIEEVANKMEDIWTSLMPVTAMAFNEFGRVAP